MIVEVTTQRSNIWSSFCKVSPFVFLVILICFANTDWFVYDTILTSHTIRLPVQEEEKRNEHQQQINNDITNDVFTALSHTNTTAADTVAAASSNDSSPSSSSSLWDIQLSPFIVIDKENSGNHTNNNNNDDHDDDTPTTTTTAPYRCPHYLYTKGKWVKGSPTNDNNGNGTTTTTTTTTDDTYYDWIPNNVQECHLEPWSEVSFCSMLQNRSILIVGDSMNSILFSALLSHLDSAIRVNLTTATTTTTNTTDANNSSTRTKERERHAVICKNNNDNNHLSSKLTFVRNDWLTIDDTFHQSTVALLSPWIQYLQTHEIVVLNTGAHSRLVSVYNQTLIELNEYLQQHYNGTVIFRTTPRGHIGCNVNDTEPIVLDVDHDNDENNTTTRNNDDIDHVNNKKYINNQLWQRFFNITDDDDSLYKRYRYNLFPEYNSIMKHVASLHSNYHIIDIAPIYELRPDVHNPPKDCLHVYGNNARTIWIQLLLNVLKGYLDEDT